LLSLWAGAMEEATHVGRDAQLGQLAATREGIGASWPRATWRACAAPPTPATACTRHYWEARAGLRCGGRATSRARRAGVTRRAGGALSRPPWRGGALAGGTASDAYCVECERRDETFRARWSPGSASRRSSRASSPSPAEPVSVPLPYGTQGPGFLSVPVDGRLWVHTVDFMFVPPRPLGSWRSPWSFSLGSR
jgi:hypothetical protein